MHEASIVANLIRAVTERVAGGGIEGRIVAVHLRLGRLTAAVPESLKFFFEALSPGTPVEGAKLVIELIPVRCSCQSCGGTFEVEELRFACERCGSGDVAVVTGRELLVDAVEVE